MLWAKEMLKLFFPSCQRAIDQSVEWTCSYLHYKHSHQQKASPMLGLDWLWAPSSVFKELLHSLSFCLALAWIPHLKAGQTLDPQPRSFIFLLKDPLNESDFQPRDQNTFKTTEWAHNTLITSALACALHTDRRGAWILFASAYSLMSTHRQPCASFSLAHPYLKFKSFRWALCHLCPNVSEDPAHACLLEMIRAHMTV